MRKDIINIKFKTELDPARLESFGEEWQYMTVRAEASIVLGENNQLIWGGLIGGIESDSDDEYLKEYKIEAFDDLKEQLKAIGFKDKIIESFRQSYMESSE